MREFLNSDTFFNTLAMYSAGSGSLILAVEGPFDELLLREHCDDDLEIFHADGGKARLLEVAELAARRCLINAVFLVDRDFDDFLVEPASTPSNVIITDNHDAFIDILRADPKTFTRVLEVHTGSIRQGRSRDFVAPDISEVLESAVDAARRLAAIHIVNVRYDLGLRFSGLGLGSFNIEKLSIAEVVNALVRRSAKISLGAEEIERLSEEVYSSLSTSGSYAFRDHDLFEAIALLLRDQRVFVKSDVLHRGVVIGTTCAVLRGLSWVRAIQEWSKRQGFSAFKCLDSSVLAA